MNLLSFGGDLNLGIGLALSGAAALLVGWWYRRQVAGQQSALARHGLPLLRAAVVLLLCLMLTGPALREIKRIEQRGRVLVFVDGSASMDVADDQFTPQRKLLIARRLGWLDDSQCNTALLDIAGELADAHTALETRRQTADGPSEETIAKVKLALRRCDQQLSGLVRIEWPAPIPKTGFIERRVWSGVDPRSPFAKRLQSVPQNAPTSRGLLTVCEAPHNAADHYLQQLRGYVVAPATGDYVFWIAADEMAQLYLSQDSRPESKRLIARVDRPTPPRAWGNKASQSSPIHLEKDGVYYLEAWHTDFGGPDHVAVGWRLPDGAEERPIPGSRLAPYATSDGATVLVGTPQQVLPQFTHDLVSHFPAEKSQLAKSGDSKSAGQNPSHLSRLSRDLARYEVWLRQVFDRYCIRRSESTDPAIQEAMHRLNSMPRRQRIEQELLAGATPLLASVGQKCDVLLYDIREHESVAIRSGGVNNELPNSLPKYDRAAMITDLGTPLEEQIKGLADTRPLQSSTPSTAQMATSMQPIGLPPPPATAAVLLSDGQHNDGPSPMFLAQLLKQRDIPLHTVGYGAASLPSDAAILGVDAPSSVYFEDRLQGQILLYDTMLAGEKLTVAIQYQGRDVWQQETTSNSQGRRSIPFDLPMKNLVAALLAATDQELATTAVPLQFSIQVRAAGTEARADNNLADLFVRAVTRKRKVLLIDSRPRWETRYLRNILERDRRWAVETILVGPAAERQALPHGDGQGSFPTDLKQLNTYDLIILGDIPATIFQEPEQKAISEFVASRGGGLILIDGRDKALATFQRTPLEPLLPIRHVGSASSELVKRLSLTDAGARFDAMNLGAAQGENASLWKHLPSPHAVAPSIVLPGAEVLAEAIVADRVWPAYVQQRYGAGRVFYAAVDETWRWRFEVADRYQERFWKQICEAIMEKPFAVADGLVQLDVDETAYRPGQKAAFRVRLQKTAHDTGAGSLPTIVVERDGQPVQTVALEQDATNPGLFRGTSQPLTEGQYRVRVALPNASAEQQRAHTEFFVAPGQTGERVILNLNDQTLRALAAATGGRYLPEEDVRRLDELLTPLRRSRDVVFELQLWRSYYWFVPIMVLLAVEWILRKRVGLL